MGNYFVCPFEYRCLDVPLMDMISPGTGTIMLNGKNPSAQILMCMLHFPSWKIVVCQGFLVDNTDLKSSSSGLRYRKSPSFGETSKSKPASVVRWNSLVYGDLDVDGNWLKLQETDFAETNLLNRCLQRLKSKPIVFCERHIVFLQLN